LGRVDTGQVQGAQLLATKFEEVVEIEPLYHDRDGLPWAWAQFSRRMKLEAL